VGQTHVPLGHVTGPPQVFVLTVVTSGAKPHFCGHHRRAVVAIGRVVDPSQVFALVMGTKKAKPYPTATPEELC